MIKLMRKNAEVKSHNPEYIQPKHILNRHQIIELIEEKNKDLCKDKIIYYFDNISDFYTELDRILKIEDTVLVKASHGMNFVKIIDILKEISL